ncbi:MAG: hypothetical protein RLZZ612_2269 [Pseudomonadota bacterium]
MNFFTTPDGARLAFQDEGQRAGIPLLALAGLTRDSRDFDYMAQHLPQVRLMRLDSRGRGRSAWTGPDTYTVAQEAQDALALLDHLGVERAALIGSSRGGLLGMVMAATHKDRLLGICLNDIGPVIERSGLDRIRTYLGMTPPYTTLTEVARCLPLTTPGFDGVPHQRWMDEAIRHFVPYDGYVGLTYDPALRLSFEAAMAAPPVDLWPLFDACAGLPLALIRGAHSDVLTAATAQAMQQRRPDMSYAEIPNRGHIPFLDEAESLHCIHAWLDAIEAQG